MFWVVTKIKGKVDYWKRQMSLFYYNRSSSAKVAHQQLFRYREIENMRTLDKYNFEYDVADYEGRFSAGHIMCVFTDNKVIVSYGWINPNNRHILGELALDMIFNLPTDVLYDFHTFENFRGKGLYPALLQRICIRNSKAKLIYAFPNNQNSVKGILKASFIFLGNIRGWNKQYYKKLIRKHEGHHF